MTQEEIELKYSDEAIREKIIAKIKRKFGKNHKIKVAIYKPVSEYNDEGYDYNPLLILIDENFEEVDHNINVEDLVPSYDDQNDYGEETGDIIEVDNITIKF